jgi:hypothetical protein
MTSKEQAHKLHMRYYFSLPNNGGHTGIVSIPVRWREGLECAIIAAETVLNEYDRITDPFEANKSYVLEKEYWSKVKQILEDKLKEENRKTDSTYE